MFRDENDRRDFSINASALKYGSKFILFLRKTHTKQHQKKQQQQRQQTKTLTNKTSTSKVNIVKVKLHFNTNTV